MSAWIRTSGILVMSMLAVAACGGGRRAGGSDVDAGGERDAGRVSMDASTVDGDAGGAVADAGARDAATIDDAGGASDAGSVVTRDAGPDAGLRVDAGTPIPLSFCQRGCDAPADCASTLTLYDASHYACELGACRWLGCRTDSECMAAFSSSAYACRAVGTLSICVRTCSVPADCASSPAFDADNYACESGACRYLGCIDDPECAATFASIRYVCAEVLPPDTGVPIPVAARNCVLGCVTTSDCSTGTAAFDADNYTCMDGACRYTGCNTDAECVSTFMMSGYVCR